MFLKLLDYMKTSGVSQSQVAAALGISKTALSQYLADKYVGDVGKIDVKVGAYLRVQEKRSQAAKLNIGFVYTKTAKQILSFLSMTHVLWQLGIMYGDAGTGKTTAQKEYKKNIQDKGGKIDNLEAFKRDVERIEFVDGKVEITFQAA